MGTKYPLHPCAVCGEMTHNQTFCTHKCQAARSRTIPTGGPKECTRCNETKPFEDFIHRSKQKVSVRQWCQECRKLLPQAANIARAASLRRRNKAKLDRREQVDEALKHRDWPPVMVEASGRQGELLLNDLILGGLPGTSILACPFAA